MEKVKKFDSSNSCFADGGSIIFTETALVHPKSVDAIFKMAGTLKQKNRKLIIHQASIQALRNRERDLYGKPVTEITEAFEVLKHLLKIHLVEIKGEPNDRTTPVSAQILRYCTEKFQYGKCLIVTQSEDFAKEISRYQNFCSVAQVPVEIRAAKIDPNGYLRLYRS